MTKLPDEIRFPIIMGYHSSTLKWLIDETIAAEEAEMLLRAVAGPDIEDAAMARADDKSREWIPIGGGVAEQRGPVRAKRLVADEIMRGEWP